MGRMWRSALGPVRSLGPFSIYDGIVRERLGTPRGDSLAYVPAREPGHQTHECANARACTKLSRDSHWRQSPAGLSDTSVKPPLRAAWSRRRVPNLVIWNGGISPNALRTQLRCARSPLNPRLDAPRIQAPRLKVT
jgi:hypothetical protein